MQNTSTLSPLLSVCSGNSKNFTITPMVPESLASFQPLSFMSPEDTLVSSTQSEKTPWLSWIMEELELMTSVTLRVLATSISLMRCSVFTFEDTGKMYFCTIRHSAMNTSPPIIISGR